MLCCGGCCCLGDQSVCIHEYVVFGCLFEKFDCMFMADKSEIAG